MFQAIRNNKLDTIIVLALILSVSLNLWQHFGNLDTTKGELERIEMQNQIDSLSVHISHFKRAELKHLDKIDSLANVKKKPIYIFKNTEKKRDDKINNYYSSDDSTRFYNGAKRTLYFTIPKEHNYTDR